MCARAVRGRAGPERWSSVAILVCLCDLCLTYSSHYRYSLGWYTGRTLTVTAAAVVLIAMLASFRRLKATAEFNAAYDGLTALANRRSAYDSLAAMIARARRTGTPLSVVLFDLDHFKQINDNHGHAAGDEVLRSVADTMRQAVRDTDLVRPGRRRGVRDPAARRQPARRPPGRRAAARPTAVPAHPGHRLQRHGQPRHRRTAAGRRHPRAPAAARRPGDVPGQGARSRPDLRHRPAGRTGVRGASRAARAENGDAGPPVASPRSLPGLPRSG